MKTKVGEGFTALPSGQYRAVIAAITHGGDHGYGASLQWKFKFSDGPERPLQWGWSVAEFTPTNKAGRWAAAALGRQLQPGEEFDTDALLGREVIVVIGVQDSGNIVRDVMPLDRDHDDEEDALALASRLLDAPSVAELDAVGEEIRDDYPHLADRLRSTYVAARARLER